MMTSDAEENFSVPAKSIRWALSAIDEFRRLWRQSAPVCCAVRDRPVPGTTSRRRVLELVQPFPDGMERSATEALQNLRNSFDQSLYAAQTALSVKSKNYFPWATSPADLETRLRGIPGELHAAIRELHPYGREYGGDDVVRAAAHLVNDKHRIGFRLGAAVSSLYVSEMQSGSMTMQSQFRWNPSERVVEIATLSADARWSNGSRIDGVVRFETNAAALQDVTAQEAMRRLYVKAEESLGALRKAVSS